MMRLATYMIVLALFVMPQLALNEEVIDLERFAEKFMDNWQNANISRVPLPQSEFHRTESIYQYTD